MSGFLLWNKFLAQAWACKNDCVMNSLNVKASKYLPLLSKKESQQKQPIVPSFKKRLLFAQTKRHL